MLFTWDAIDNHYQAEARDRPGPRWRPSRARSRASWAALQPPTSSWACSRAYSSTAWCGCLHRSAPETGRWLRTVLPLLAAGTILDMARQMITFPALYAGYPPGVGGAGRAVWVDGVWAAFAIGLIAVGWSRWGEYTTRFGQRLAILGVAALFSGRTPINAEKAQDNEEMNLVLIGVVHSVPIASGTSAMSARRAPTSISSSLRASSTRKRSAAVPDLPRLDDHHVGRVADTTRDSRQSAHR